MNGCLQLGLETAIAVLSRDQGIQLIQELTIHADCLGTLEFKTVGRTRISIAGKQKDEWWDMAGKTYVGVKSPLSRLNGSRSREKFLTFS